MLPTDKPFSPVFENYLFLDKSAHYLGAHCLFEIGSGRKVFLPPPTCRLFRDILRPLGSQSVGIVFIDRERDSHSVRVGPGISCQTVSRGSNAIFLKLVFFLSWIGPASSWEDVSKATSLTMSQK